MTTGKVNTVLKTSTIDTIARVLGRYGLVIVIGWIGALKFAHYEARQIQPLVANSPFMGWLYNLLISRKPSTSWKRPDVVSWPSRPTSVISRSSKPL